MSSVKAMIYSFAHRIALHRIELCCVVTACLQHQKAEFQAKVPSLTVCSQLPNFAYNSTTPPFNAVLIHDASKDSLCPPASKQYYVAFYEGNLESAPSNTWGCPERSGAPNRCVSADLTDQCTARVTGLPTTTYLRSSIAGCYCMSVSASCHVRCPCALKLRCADVVAGID